ncbi:MAG: hypothetical protein OET90_11275 [Desulfuromonadales bacterium]|nr:hypothetical protein [Desulfuromonadales bacterium]
MFVTKLRAAIVRRTWAKKVRLPLADNKYKLITNASELGLMRDVEILGKGVEEIRYLEIHVH